MRCFIDRRIVILVLLGTVLCGSGCDKRQPIQIGFVAGLSGRVADLGIAGRNGVMLAVEQTNKTGGIRGHNIELLVRDDRQDAETAKKVISELLSEDLEVIIGPMTSSMAVVMVPLVNASSTIMVSPTVTTTDLAGKNDQFFRVVSTTRDYAAKSARYQYEIIGRRNAVAIYDLNNKAYTESWFRDFREMFESMGGRIVKTHAFRSSNHTAFFKVTQELLSTHPDLVLIVSNAVDAALICQQVRKMDKQVAIVMSEWASTERFIELGGTATEGVHVAQFLNRNDSSKNYQDFRSAYIERFGQEPGFAGVAGYDAARMVMLALANRKPGQSLKQTILDKGRFQCVQQSITIDRFGDAKRSTFIAIVQNGKFQKIE